MYWSINTRPQSETLDTPSYQERAKDKLAALKTRNYFPLFDIKRFCKKITEHISVFGYVVINTELNYLHINT